MTVIVATERIDPTSDVVIDLLNQRRVEVLRADLDELVVSARLLGGQWVGEIGARNRSVTITEVTGIYWRRPSSPTPPSGLSPEVARWVVRERRWGIEGLLVALPRAVWLSWPPAVHAAEHKPYALAAAAQCGMSIPPTLITNDPDTACAFAASSDALYKSFRGGPTRLDDGSTVLTYATPVTAAQIDDSVRVAPITLQRRVNKIRDVRVTCVDGHVFGISPHRDGVTPLDWRDDHDANTWEHVEVPRSVANQLGSLLRRLELRYCAADFAVGTDGVWHHLDLNPVGQWAWTHPHREAIASALADALTREDQR